MEKRSKKAATLCYVKTDECTHKIKIMWLFLTIITKSEVS